MRYNPYSKVSGTLAAFAPGCVGIEVEVEEFDRAEYDYVSTGGPFDSSYLRTALRHGWTVTTDGSLRGRGAEFISPVWTSAQAHEGLGALYAAMRRGLFAPSVRTGIHIHVNVAPLNDEDIVRVMRAYAVLEPLLFRFVGVEREQNIYCVPLYRAGNERRVWQNIARLLHRGVRTGQAALVLRHAFESACKYSALNLSPFRRLGTFEFRQAPTFEKYAEAAAWLRLVEYVMSFRLPDNADISALAPVEEWATALIPGLDWAGYLREVEERGLLGFAQSLQPCTYKVAEWGRPAGLAFGESPKVTRSPAETLSRFNLEQIVASMDAAPTLTRRIRLPPMQELLADEVNNASSTIIIDEEAL